MAADPKDESFFRKVARFVANPATDWTELNSRQDDPEGDLAKAELRAMIERKRRNDFVRKRELDMLRRIRREGLTPDQLAALGSSPSRIEEAERGNSDLNSKIDQGVRQKIDEIEQQMVGEHFLPSQMRNAHPPGFFETSTRPVHFASTQTTDQAPPARPEDVSVNEEIERVDIEPAHAAATMHAGTSPLSDGKAAELPPLDMSLSFNIADDGSAPIEVKEFVHDPELDEAVIAFANADYETCERVLVEMTQPGGPRNLHGETWLVLFDHYRATGQQAKFEALATEYAQQFGLSSPQWFSMPKQVAEAARQVRSPMGESGGVGWTAPEYLVAESVQQLQSRSQALPMPWVFDWAPLRQIDLEAAEQLRQLFKSWGKQQVDMSWLAGDHFLQLLKDLAPVAVRDVDPVLWMLRLEALRLANRPDQFDEAAIDYCVTYEVSPPSWERAKCRVKVNGEGLSTQGPVDTSVQPSETSISFLDSGLTDGQASNSVKLELSGQLSGDISETLQLMTAEVRTASVVVVACPKLIRLDFMAAGDLLNWVLARRGENRTVIFSETHRLVALFFGAMGINESARIKVRQN